MDHDQESGQPGPAPYYPPPQFPPPTAPPPGGPVPQPASYPTGPQHPGAMPSFQQPWQAVPAQRPSPMWGLTIPAAVLAFPLGLLAVYFSAQVNQNLRTGDLAAAAKNAGLAKTWGAILLGLGIFLTLVYIGAGSAGRY
ncbi:CD225/dispanin family protein [Pseudonocardia sp. NPDC049154]|uniref:CD225/dispanin family protein n=1 Tax=Pseudonocardia sp. NPDC049154 TaxID=3155501 RepID=UPI0033DAAF08